mgnify:CR=1 FL=1
MFIGLEGFGTTKNITDSVYGKRLLYDIAVRNIDEEGYNRINNEIEGIEILESNIYFETNFNNSYLIINALEKEHQLVKLYDKNNSLIEIKNGIVIDEITANNYNLKIGDFIEINGYSLQIDGVAREILAHVSYMNLDTAKKCGKDSINGAMIKAKDPTQIDTIVNNIFDINDTFLIYFQFFFI